MKTLILVMTVLISALTYASFKKGNGGNAIYCPDSAWQILDSYETEHVLFLKKDTSLDHIDFQKLIIERIKSISPQLARSYTEHLALLPRQSRWLTNIDLGPVSDSFHFVFPKDCHLRQVAIQTADVYLFQTEIWDQLSGFEKNVLLTHELVYRALSHYLNLENSRPVRALVGLLISVDFKTLSPAQRLAFIKKHQIQLPD